MSTGAGVTITVGCGGLFLVSPLWGICAGNRSLGTRALGE